MSPRLLLLAALLAPSLGLAETATFGRRQSVVGDAVEQSVRLEMKLDTTMRQGTQVIDQDSSEVERVQRRLVTASSTREGRVVGAAVRFFEATSTHNGESAADIVAGKTYHCERGENDKLSVLTEKGTMPTLEEYALVVRAMETLGTASPLAEFLAGKTIAVGEKLDIPAELAQRALGFDKQFGTVDKFTLTLEELRDVEGLRVARFAADVEASATGSGQMGLFVEGVFEIEEPTCRMVSADLTGPIALSGQQGVGVTAHQVDSRGRMRMRLAARYRDATR
ncbi:hypothetical protein [Botrimarina mediterranea]|uniref:Uncharacterized protein n=1 Tax=Botrimarina mediterranea TaxID=2528022 RepID=A0A518K3K3_9BACT|nr:hypothetical protein [Botrimarina mediterranea]QDV72388.1 hypothetical protein Spa11_05630 [Botrimarina mediterranea]QDV76934.1 hypothetical protein K2D_05180 [Planctomycetes bacterium K2D]